jgi:epoxide hydrolase-like predicted phosphatase
MALRAVIFDLGGVVFDSPLHFLTEFERTRGLEPNLIARIVGGYGGADGPWQRLERGEVSLAEFCGQFDRDLRAAGAAVSSAEMMREMSGYSVLRPAMLAAVRTLRAAGYLTGALTNNWVTDDEHDSRLAPLRKEFDAFVESCKVGMRKPEERIYVHACEALAVTPTEAVFLDDIGGNLKVAKKLGMTTIKVVAPGQALGELGALLGMELV